VSPFVEISRADWAALGRSTELPLTEQEISQIRGLGDFLDLKEVSDVYLPLSRLLNLYVTEAQRLHSVTSEFLGERAKRTPFIIGVAGSVAVGKSTVARLLKEMLSRWPSTPRVELVTTDGFLYPNAELERRNLMHRKGFPESYDRLALLKFVADIKSGVERVSAPVYSHLSYDIVPGAEVVIESPDVVIVEGLNVLQPPVMGQEVALSDYFDFKIYVDADVESVTQWFIGRFEQLREGAFTNPKSYFHRYAEMPFEQALARANEIWRTINLPNLIENIQPTRSRATLVLQKGSNHAVQSVLLRKA
jgi:type I pantothenate kinase